MLEQFFDGLRLITSYSAEREMLELGLRIRDCLESLENGYEPSRTRGKNTIEKWLDEGSKTCNVVAVRSYNYLLGEEVYLITHVGRFGRRV
ncbi:hypothetical protein HY993_00950 [Candidatus Micrarchaeota archaeon]|nr:hypothetical protein [Candidatus Micrarchaeota archaeon]